MQFQTYNSTNEFEFDCPNLICDLANAQQRSLSCNTEIEEWFQFAHGMHEKNTNNIDNNDNLLKKGPIRRESMTSAVVIENTVESADKLSLFSSSAEQSVNQSNVYCVSQSNFQLSDENANVNIDYAAMITKPASRVVSSIGSGGGRKKAVAVNGGTSKRSGTVVGKSISSTIGSSSQSVHQAASSEEVVLASKKAKLGQASSSQSTHQQQSGANLTVNSNGTVSVASRYLQPAVERASSATTTTRSSASRPVVARKTVPAVSGKVSKGHTTSAAKKEAEEAAELAALLRKHNEKFAPVSAYEPPRHSVREVRQWEKLSGLTWNSLKPDEREKVNAEITRMKANNLIKT